jgi:hypothetical protein
MWIGLEIIPKFGICGKSKPEKADRTSLEDIFLEDHELIP